MRSTILLALASSLALVAPLARTGNTRQCVPLARLQLDPKLPSEPSAWRSPEQEAFLRPYAALDGKGEVFVGFPEFARELGLRRLEDAWIAIEVPSGEPMRGTLFVPSGEPPKFQKLRFELSPSASESADDVHFELTKAELYADLLASGAPGAAWFRHRLELTRKALESNGAPIRDGLGNFRDTFSGDGELDETYDLFTGGRALSENLRLDRLPASTDAVDESVPIADIAGIATRAFDWTALVKDLKVEPETLATLVPADQHAVFFPSFDALAAVVDEIDASGTPLAQLAEERSEDATTRTRYERQMCLPFNERLRELGPLVVKSVALTGSDPYLRTGSDVAVLLETDSMPALKLFLATQRQVGLRRESGGRAQQGDIEGVHYDGALNDDRRLSTYCVCFEHVAVVTNSLQQLRQVIAVSKKSAPSLASTPEYVFFRDRYRRAADGESAFAILTDATIRRWCGPRWRIAASRRARAAAVMSEAQAARVSVMAEGRADVAPEPRDPTWGTLEFLTPIAEVALEKVAPAERDAYNAFRTRFESNWRQVFDPIALRIAIRPSGIGADLSVMPLIQRTDYGELMRLAEGGLLPPTAGDPHADALVHFALGIDLSSPSFLREMGMAGGMATQMFGADPLAWVGKSLALYADEDPFWKEWADAAAEDDQDVFMEDEFVRMPVALRIDVKDPLRLAAFLTSLRAMSDQSAPGMVRWETRKHGETPYVALFSPQPLSGKGQLAIFYAALPDALILTLREDVLQHALDRRAAPKPADAAPWLGTSVGLRVQRPFLDLVSTLLHEERESRAQRIAWSNLPILNEWRRLFPDKDALALHEALWKVKLTSPGGGSYEWNEEWRTYASTLYGCPAAPREGPDLALPIDDVESASFGLTFEHDGLRARAEVERAQR